MTLTARPAVQSPIGYFRIFTRPPGGERREITMFRGAPVVMTSCASGDPFSDQTANLSLPQVTPWDRPGFGDLDWMVPSAQVDVVWENYGYYDYVWSWEGNIVSFDFDMSGSGVSYTLSLRGALYGLDDYLAKPSFPKQPIPYEHLIRSAFDQSKYPCGLAPIRITFPDDWAVTVPSIKDDAYLSTLKPWGVRTGDLWTGFTSRNTGSWEPMLTGHVQSMLTNMYADGGSQWSIRNLGRRRPELYLRRRPEAGDNEVLVIELGMPGVDINGSKDYTQRANVIYGSGKDEAGVSFNGMQVTPNGSRTYFKPFAYSPASYPRAGNPQFNSRVPAKEVMMQFQDGISEDAALMIAQAQLHRFSDPGITGNITLTSDIRTVSGEPFPRWLIKGGQSILIKGLLGIEEGVLAHITSSQVDFNALTVSLSYDTKYRDELTVEEVRARTKDSLTPLRKLQVGKYSNTVQDLIFPWSYKEGSGCIPKGSKNFFLEKLPSNATFPYEEYTRAYPPKNQNYSNYYVKIGTTNVSNSNKNWSGETRNGTTVMAIPFRMGQAGQIKLTQIAAYDRNGNVFPCRFHVSIYSNNAIATDAMPRLPAQEGATTGDISTVPYLKPDVDVSYKVGQSHPFYKGAWEQYDEDGTEYDEDVNLTANGAGLVVGWGNYYEPAGYWPGRYSRGAAKSGMLVDTTPWSWDLVSAGVLDVYNPANNDEEYAGMLFVQIYCDDQIDEPVFFMGRVFVQEAGSTT